MRARDREPRRALGIVLSCLVPFGLVYPDADMAHRLAIAPAVFAILAATGIAATKGTLKGWTPVAAAGIVSVVLSGALLARSSWQYFRQAEFLRSTQLALTISDPATLARAEAWRLRQANAALSEASHVCTMTQENMQGLWGHSFEPVAATGRRVGREILEWRAGALDRCDAILLGPNGYDAPPPAVLARLEAYGGQSKVTGTDVEIRGLKCTH
jgi:membrane-bound ClpP family serine protease